MPFLNSDPGEDVFDLSAFSAIELYATNDSAIIGIVLKLLSEEDTTPSLADVLAWFHLDRHEELRILHTVRVVIAYLGYDPDAPERGKLFDPRVTLQGVQELVLHLQMGGDWNKTVRRGCEYIPDMLLATKDPEMTRPKTRPNHTRGSGTTTVLPIDSAIARIRRFTSELLKPF